MKPELKAELEACGKAMFELRPAFKGTSPDSDRWTWENLATPDVREYWRDNALACARALPLLADAVAALRMAQPHVTGEITQIVAVLARYRLLMETKDAD